MGPLGQTHTHKPREGVRGRRTLSSSHLTTEPRYFTPRTPHVHTSRFNKSLHRKSTKSQVKRQIKTKTTDNRVSKHFHCCFKLQPSLLREAHMEAHHIYSSDVGRTPNGPPQPYPISYGTERRALHRTCIKEGGVSPRTHIVGTPKVGPHTVQTPQCSSLVV